MSLFIDRDLQATLTRILNRPLALSRSYPNPRRLALAILNNQIIVSDGTFTEIHGIMSTTTEIVAPATPSTVLSLRPESPQSIYATPAKAENNHTEPIVDTKAKVEKARAQLEIATKEDEINTVSKSLQEKLAIVSGLESEVDEKGKTLEAKLDELNKEYEAMAKGLRDAEGMKQNHVMACKMSGNSDADKVSLRKAELEIMKMKSVLMEKEIEVMEAEMATKDHAEQKAGADTERVEAQAEVDAIKQQLIDLKEDLAKSQEEFAEKYNSISGGVSSLGATNENAGNDSTQVAALKKQIDEMKPLYWVGHGTRSRNLEFLAHKLKQGYRVDQAIMNEGLECYRFGKVAADAAMYLEFNPCKRVLYDEFELFYGVPAQVVWDHRHFTIFVNLIGWKHDMASLARAHKPELFERAYDKLFGKMYPNFELTCDADVEKDPELAKAYETAKKERMKAFAAENVQRRTNNRS
ncbi:hypothetical protein BDZ45DRAFT_763959 [Acephala macrosclerotiorum]|nr:hypothetical protein BDZ45DRAFT_763959 [Acephala macrosclerotiorum]